MPSLMYSEVNPHASMAWKANSSVGYLIHIFLKELCRDSIIINGNLMETRIMSGPRKNNKLTYRTPGPGISLIRSQAKGRLTTIKTQRNNAKLF